MRNVYLDYSATTPVKEEVLKEMIPYFTEKFGNPSSLYDIGLESKDAITNAREQIAQLINAKPSEIYFTAGGTEADNWALLGASEKLKAKGNHIITTKVEHHAVLHSCEFLEKQGFYVTYLDIDKEGRIDLKDLESKITDKTILISIMLINNEIGTVEPVKEAAAIAKKHNILFHTDAVQALGNVPIDVKDMGIDMMSISAHKIYGPKGVGALYLRKGLKIENYMHGGGQENRKRAGTENLAGIVGFGKAAEISRLEFDRHVKHCSELRDYFKDRILSEIPDTMLNGTMDGRHPGNLSITFNYIEGEAILLLLNQYGISVSTGSACSSASLEPSHVLSALDVPVEMIHGTVRFTVGDFTTKEDIDYVTEKLKTIITKLREISSVNSKKGW